MTDLESWWSSAQEMCQLYNLHSPFSPEDFCAAYNTVERYPIILQPMGEGRHVSGVCYFKNGTFYIFHSTAGSRLLQDRTIWHEIGHVVLGHVGPENPGVRMKHDVVMTTVQENEAEDFAAIMTVYATLRGHLRAALPSPRTQARSGQTSFEQVVNGLLRGE